MKCLRWLSLALITSIAHADDIYQLPTDGWYQLQTVGSLIEVCTSSTETDTPCRVISGVEYWLINHSVPTSDSAHRQRFTAETGGTEPTTPVAGFQRVDNRCDFSRGAPVSGFPVSCRVSCPIDTTLVGVVECSASISIGASDDRLTAVFESSDQIVSCTVPYEDVRRFNFGPTSSESGFISVGAVCAGR